MMHASLAIPSVSSPAQAGEHTEEVLDKLGYWPAAIEDYIRAGHSRESTCKRRLSKIKRAVTWVCRCTRMSPLLSSY